MKKRIIDYKWKLSIDDDGDGGYFWNAGYCISGVIDVWVTTEKSFVTKRGAKKSWEDFAKLNKIKKWRYDEN